MNTTTDWDSNFIPSNADSVISGLILGRGEPNAPTSSFREDDASEMHHLETARIENFTVVTTDQFPLRVSRTITDLPNEPYSLLRPIPMVVEETTPGSFTASFSEANIAASGDSIEEAEENLKAHILDVYELLREEQPARLGPGPRNQLAALRSFLREKSAHKQRR